MSEAKYKDINTEFFFRNETIIYHFKNPMAPTQKIKRNTHLDLL